MEKELQRQPPWGRDTQPPAIGQERKTMNLWDSICLFFRPGERRFRKQIDTIYDEPAPSSITGRIEDDFCPDCAGKLSGQNQGNYYVCICPVTRDE